MQGDAGVRDGLQRLAASLLDLGCQYMLDAINTKRLGLSIADGLDQLAGQCFSDAKDLVRWIYFLDGQPTMGSARSRPTVSQIVGDSLAAEGVFLNAVNQLAEQARVAGDMSVFHGLQHLAKWHSIGGGVLGATDRTGHIAWLQKQDWQLREFGEKDYEETKV